MEEMVHPLHRVTINTEQEHHPIRGVATTIGNRHPPGTINMAIITTMQTEQEPLQGTIHTATAEKAQETMTGQGHQAMATGSLGQTTSTGHIHQTSTGLNHLGLSTDLSHPGPSTDPSHQAIIPIDRIGIGLSHQEEISTDQDHLALSNTEEMPLF